MNIFQKTVGFIKEVRQELSKVSWSTRKELIGSTAVVIVVTGILAAYVGVLDVILYRILSSMFK